MKTVGHVHALRSDYTACKGESSIPMPGVTYLLYGRVKVFRAATT